MGQRQVFQTANLEAARASLETSEQIQREQARRKHAEERMAEAQAEVHTISSSDEIRTEERRQRQNSSRRHSHGDEEEEGAPQAQTAKAADGHLDFLA